MITLTQKEIKVSKKAPKMIIIVGPCRVGTTALANIFSKVGLTVYMQPIKSARRAKENNEKAISWEILEEDTAVAKETLGARTEAEFFDPVKILLGIGYPKEKLILIPIIRDPRKTLASWRNMWEDLNLEKFIQSYKLISEIKKEAENAGIKTIPYVHEVIRDQSSDVVIQKLFKELGLKINISKDVIDWTNGSKFGEENSEKSHLKFYDEPPYKFVKEVKEWGAYQYREEPNLRLSPEDAVFLNNNRITENIYEEFRQECQNCLNLEIKPFSSINYW